MENKKGTIAAITAAVAAYVEEERKALRPAIPQRRLVAVSTLWSNSGREEIMRMRMRMLWQRRIVPKVVTFSCYPGLKL